MGPAPPYTFSMGRVGDGVGEVGGVFIQCCFRPPDTIRTIRDGEPRTSSTSYSFTQLLTSEILTVRVQCCFKSTEILQFEFSVALSPQRYYSSSSVLL